MPVKSLVKIEGYFNAIFATRNGLNTLEALGCYFTPILHEKWSKKCFFAPISLSVNTLAIIT